MNRAGRSPSSNGKSLRAEQPDPFRFCWRYVQQIGPSGVKQRVREPLTLDDVLHPQEGDHVSQNTDHDGDCLYLRDIFRFQTRNDLDTLVAHDLLVNWGIPGLRGHSPDIILFREIDEPDRTRWRLAEGLEVLRGVVPLLVEALRA